MLSGKTKRVSTVKGYWHVLACAEVSDEDESSSPSWRTFSNPGSVETSSHSEVLFPFELLPFLTLVTSSLTSVTFGRKFQLTPCLQTDTLKICLLTSLVSVLLLLP
jgi:hypothetical protein